VASTGLSTYRSLTDSVLRGVDFIKLDYVTPGSPQSGQPLDPDTSGVVECYHRAIEQSGRQLRLDISWKLDWQDEAYYTIWSNK